MLETGPIMLNISNSIASVTEGSRSPTYKEPEVKDAAEECSGGEDRWEELSVREVSIGELLVAIDIFFSLKKKSRKERKKEKKN
jgi:hypothetical protein